MNDFSANVINYILIRHIFALIFLSLYRYVFWDQHEPVEGVYNFEDGNDLVGFIQSAQKIGFVVILRVGP